MKKLLISSFAIIGLTLFACRPKDNKTFVYSSLSFDTSKTIIFPWDSTFTLITFTTFSELLALDNDDISLVDSLLKDAVARFNKANSRRLYEKFNRQAPIDSFMIDLSKYKRQFFPYKDLNGQRILHLVCFSKFLPEWRTKIYHGGLNGGITNFTLRINLSDRKADEFSTGGYG